VRSGRRLDGVGAGDSVTLESAYDAFVFGIRIKFGVSLQLGTMTARDTSWT
jgi:hypothetical protein